MKVGILSDIHGNFPALEAVLEKLNRAGITNLLFLGDLVGYHYQPAKVLRALFDGEFEVTAIRGNHEDMLFEAIENETRRVEIQSKYGSGIDCAIEQLNESQLALLGELPDQCECCFGDRNFLLTHGSPFDPAQYVYPDSERALLERCGEPEADFVLMGHTHYPFVSVAGGSILINPGSVGQPRDTGNLASYAIVDTEAMSVKLERVEFATGGLIAEIEQNDPELPYLKDILSRA